MYPSNPRPKWWQLYLIFPLLIGLFVVDHRLRLSQNGHMAVQIGIILLVYGLIHLWLNANTAALSQMDRMKYRGTIRIIRVPVFQLPEDNDKEHPLFQLPDSEVKGVLSNTFEMDYIDAEAFPVDEVSQELKRK